MFFILIFLMTLLEFPLIHFQGIQAQEKPTLEQPLSNYVIACDIHGVLFTLDKKAAAWAIFTAAPTYIRNFFRILSTEPKNFTAWKDALEPLTNCQNPTTLIHFLKQLKDAGATIYAFSNSRPETFKKCREKFPAILKLTTDSSGSEAGVFDGFVTVGPETGWYTKSHPDFYRTFREKIDTDNPANADKKIILLDDDAKNCKQARDLGWEAIYVRSTEQCIAELTNYLTPDAVSHSSCSNSPGA